MKAPTVMPARFIFHVCDGLNGCGVPKLYELTVAWFLGVEHPQLAQNILKLYSEQRRRLTKTADTRIYLLSIGVAGSSSRSYILSVR